MVDASAVAALLLNQRSAARLRQRLDGETALHAPHLLDLEVTQALRRALRRGLLTEAVATARLADLEALRLLRYPHAPFLKRI